MSEPSQNTLSIDLLRRKRGRPTGDVEANKLLHTAECCIDDFWNRVAYQNPNDLESSCWLYVGGYRFYQNQFYGVFLGEHAHRVAASLYAGTEVGRVQRTCQSPLCVKKEHFCTIGFKPQRRNYNPITGEKIPHLDSIPNSLKEYLAETRYKGQRFDMVRIENESGGLYAVENYKSWIVKTVIPTLLYERKLRRAEGEVFDFNPLYTGTVDVKEYSNIG